MARKKVEERKLHSFAVRLSQSQLEKLKEDACRYGLSEAEYFRRLLEQKPMVKLNTIKDINALRMELHYVSNNLNQVAHALNGHYYTSPEASEKIGRVAEKLYEALDKICEAFATEK